MRDWLARKIVAYQEFQTVATEEEVMTKHWPEIQAWLTAQPDTAEFMPPAPPAEEPVEEEPQG